MPIYLGLSLFFPPSLLYTQTPLSSFRRWPSCFPSRDTKKMNPPILPLLGSGRRRSIHLSFLPHLRLPTYYSPFAAGNRGKIGERKKQRSPSNTHTRTMHSHTKLMVYGKISIVGLDAAYVCCQAQSSLPKRQMSYPKAAKRVVPKASIAPFLLHLPFLPSA